MQIEDSLIRRFRVEPGTKVRLREWPTKWDGAGDIFALEKEGLKDEAAAFVAERVRELGEAQELLWVDNRYAVLIIFQGADASGKDGAIKHLTSGLNPMGVRVVSFKRPTPAELDRNYLWRYIVALPEQGQIVIFNRSYYEEVGVVRVNPELLQERRMPDRKVNARFWEERFEDINFLERHLRRNGTVVLKFFLHLSREEQKKRFLERLENPAKQWKFDPADLAARDRWTDYQRAYEEMITKTSTRDAPWWLVPADRKWVARAIVAQVVVRELKKLDLRYPPLDEAKRAQIEEAVARLRAEA